MQVATPARFPRLTGVAATAALALVVALGGCSGNMAGMPMGDGANPNASSSPAATASFNDTDVMFAQMMIPHHEQAVTMSDMILAKTDVDGDVTSLARQIKQAQQPEIDTMNGWLTAWGQPAAGDMGGMNHGGDDGMMSADDMEALDTADGPTGQRLYLEGMIEHHKGAVRMAQDEIINGNNPDAVALAKTIVETQNAEIVTMEDLLTTI